MAGSTPTIVLTIVSLEAGGAQVQLIALAKHLKSRGWRVVACSILNLTFLASELEDEGIEVRILNSGQRFHFFSVFSNFIRLLREIRPQVLVGFAYHANLLVKVCGSYTRVPRRITSIRSVQFGGRVRDWIERLTFGLAHATVVNSYQAAKLLEERKVIPRGKSLVIRNVICNQRVRDCDAASSNINERVEGQDFRWLAVGRLDPAKDYPVLLEAVSLLKRSGAHCLLKIAGEGPCRKELTALVTKLELTNEVKLLGHVDTLSPHFEWADAVVMSSWREGLPNALLEAMYWRKPVVGTNVGGIPDLIKDGTTGFLVPSRDARALAAGMERMMGLTPGQLGEMGRAAREFVSVEFAFHDIMCQWENVISRTGELGLVDVRERSSHSVCVE